MVIAHAPRKVWTRESYYRLVDSNVLLDVMTEDPAWFAWSSGALAEAAEWAQSRETFGKPLVGHQSIRIKLADLVRQIEATQAWVDLLALQHKNGTGEPASYAMLKVQATRTMENVAREAAQVLGGASFLRGSKIERIYREVRVNAIGGGSEEILLDLAGRQLFGGKR